MNKERFDVLSNPGYFIKKNLSHGARHGPSVRQTMYFKAHDMLRKARNNKNGTCKLLWKDGTGMTKTASVVYPCLSSSSDDHPLLHSCLGTGMRVGS